MLVCTRAVLLLLLCSFVSFTFGFGSDPAAIVTIGGDALASGLTVNLPNILLSKLTNLTIPEVSGTTREFFVLKITYNITNIVLHEFSVDSLDIKSIDEGFKLFVSGVVCNVSFDWHYQDQSFLIIHISDSGTGSMNFYGGTYELEFRIKENSGHPHFSIVKNNLSLKDFSLHLDGGADWFYDLFNFIISPLVKRNIQSVVQDIVSDVFDEFNQVFSSIPTTLPLIEGIGFNWALLDNFDTHGNGFGSFYSAGYFVPLSNPSAQPPFTTPSLPSQINTQQGQVIISQYTFSTLGWALYEAGSLNVTIPFGTTNDWRVLLPAFYRAYPNDNVTVSLVSYIYPGFTITPSGILFQIAPYMYWNAVTEDGTTENAFTLLVQISATVDLYFNSSSNLLHGQVGVPTFEMSLVNSNIGSFSLFQLETAINTLIYLGILPKVNHILKDGIPMPVIYGLTLDNPTIGYANGYMYLSSDVQYVGKQNSTSYTLIPPALLPRV